MSPGPALLPLMDTCFSAMMEELQVTHSQKRYLMDYVKRE